jgi:hypothetical protein
MDGDVTNVPAQRHILENTLDGTNARPYLPRIIAWCAHRRNVADEEAERFQTGNNSSRRLLAGVAA